MAINLERAAMRGRLAGAEDHLRRQVNRFEALAASIRQGLNTALTPIEDIEMPQLSAIWSDLETCWAEILSARSDIERLNKELGS